VVLLAEEKANEDIAGSVGIQGPANDRNCWVHRWRDTYATRQADARILRLRDLARFMGHGTMEEGESPMLGKYAKYAPYDSDEVRKAANLVDPCRDNEPIGIHLVEKSAMSHGDFTKKRLGPYYKQGRFVCPLWARTLSGLPRHSEAGPRQRRHSSSRCTDRRGLSRRAQ
jgi:hypothetical protein